MNSGNSAGPELFDFTRSPYMNDAIRAVQRIAEVDEWPPAYEETLKEKTSVLQEFGKTLSQMFSTMKQVQEDTPASHRENPRIEKNLERLQRALDGIMSFPDNREKSSLLENLGEAKQAVEDLFISFDALRDDEAKLTIYSRSPFVNELLRTGNGVARGAFPVEALKEKLEWMMAYWARSVQEFEVLRLGKMETVALEEKVPEIEAQYEKMGFGLKRMHGFFDSGSIEELEAGMESVRAAGESLVDLFEFIDHETRPPTSRACLRCGLDNPLEARFCKGCKFPIPDFASKDASSFSFVEEAPAGTGGRVLTSNLARLQEAVEGLESGTYSPEDFVKVLEWMESRTAEGRAQMAGMKMPVEQLADHEREKLAQARALLEAATAHLEEGLALMRRFVQDQDRRHLRDGLEKCLEGGDIFCELYSMAREAQSAAG